MQNNDLVVKEMLKKKFGGSPNNIEQQNPIRSYDEAKADGDVAGMLRAKVFSNEIRYNNTQREVEQLSISKVVTNKKALEKRLAGLEEEYKKELAKAEDSLANIYIDKINSAKDGLQKSYLRKDYMEQLELRKDDLEKKFGERIREYKTDIAVYQNKEIQFQKDNAEMIKQAEEEKRRKEVKEYLNTKDL